MKLIAWQCLRNDFKPHAAERGQVLLALGEDKPEQTSQLSLKSACI
jgi:hypothetical protein